VLVFAAFLALSTAQCSVDENTYTNGNGHTLTFGKAVSDWIPALMNLGVAEDVIYSAWMQESETRWTVKIFGTSAGDDEYCKDQGVYLAEWGTACEDLQFRVIHDLCDGRRLFLQDTLTLQEVDDSSCIGSGSSIETMLRDSDHYPRLAGDSATLIFGENGFGLLSVSDQAVLVQRWRLGKVDDNIDSVEIVDLASHPEGYACSGAILGTYYTQWTDCSARLCMTDDTCHQRRELLHDTGLNGYEGDQCSRDLEQDEDMRSCSKGKQWLQHPKECIAQDVPGGCMYCQGIALGEKTSWCLDRQGVGCNQIFVSPVAQTYCNIAFECPASVIPLSITLIISTMLLLLLAF
jgi:hypothetical protein